MTSQTPTEAASLAPPTPADKPSAAAEARARNSALQQKIDAVALATLDKLQQIAASVAVPDPLPAASKLAQRRLMANLLASHVTCGRASCRRRGACVGEPVECLTSGLMFVDPAVLEMLVSDRKRPPCRHAQGG